MTKYLLSLMMIISCLAFVAVGMIFGYDSWKKVSGALKAQGRVVEIRDSSEPGTIARTYDPVVEYLVNEKTHRIGSKGVYLYSAYSINDPVTVLYHPDRPDDGTIYSFNELWLFASMFGGAGVFGFLLSYLFIRAGAGDQESEPLPQGGGLPGEAYLQAAKAMQEAKSINKLVEVINASTTASQAARMLLPQRSLDEKREQGVLNVLRSLYVIENPRVESGFIDGDNATLFISGKQKGRKVSQKLTMQFEMGQWKIGDGSIKNGELE